MQNNYSDIHNRKGDRNDLGKTYVYRGNIWVSSQQSKTQKKIICNQIRQLKRNLGRRNSQTDWRYRRQRELEMRTTRIINEDDNEN